MTPNLSVAADHQPLLSICIVTYNTDIGELETTLQNLDVALNQPQYQINATIHIVDNSRENLISLWISERFPRMSIEVLHGHGNIGFGRANNLALDLTGLFHLVLNPDVAMLPDSLVNAITFMRDNPHCGLLTPLVFHKDHTRAYLCKRYPSVLDLVLRGFAPECLQTIFSTRLDRYRMADMDARQVYWNPPIVSGCYMLFRSALLKQLGGFDPAYFLYFEDFDLSLRAAKITDTAFVPSVRIVHLGGNAARKGFWHIRQFICSAVRFYRKFGLKLY